MNRKIMVAGAVLTLLLSAGCTSFVARKDKSQIVQFKNAQIDKDKYTIKFYRLEYPKTPAQKDKFYEEFDILTSKMVAYKKDINLIIPYEFYKDLLNLKKRDVREEEKIFYKQSYALNDDEKKIIDEKVDVSYPTNSGSVQEYLNKQVAYWYNYLGKGKEYDKNTYYTELDKDRLINEVFEIRKTFSNTCFLIENDYALEVNNKNLIEGSEIGFPLYMQTNTIDVAQLSELKPKIYIVSGDVQDTLIPNKILLINGKVVENVKDYEIDTIVEDVPNPLSLIKILDDEEGLKLKDIQDFTVKRVANATLNRASVAQPERKREKINFIDVSSKWGIEK